MFSKILIANRGEIACRVIATARRMGISTVAVYSDADAASRHVAMADEAVRIGPAAVSESYLLGDRIIEAARRTGAEAIHPGYGFLSENPDFVEAVTAAGLIFIGPPASAIRAMGLKDAAKSLMEKAGVPVVPGYHGASQDADHLSKEAEKIGYPVLIKARAGGGGKGMRRVDDPKDFKAALEGAQREGKASFGDPACLVEKYIAKPRHVEIQVFSDNQGNVVHLFERDCSLQRRHQKVIEEAPAPDMPPEVREAMGRAAVEAARTIGYSGAGTVEFIADGSGPLEAGGFWFMEMNTRLQVEHPVTEAITGLDLVELQLRVASGETLPFSQSDLSINGHAFEARIYAEDVPKGFLPATGRLDTLSFPDGVAFSRGPVRVDSGVRQGDSITPWYDPMIAKLIVHGPDRATALARLSRALDDIQVVGSVTNIPFLSALSRHAGFVQGDVDTGLIGRDLESLTVQPTLADETVALAAITALGLIDRPADSDPFSTLRGWRQWAADAQFVALENDGQRIECRVVAQSHERFRVMSKKGALDLAVQAIGTGGVEMTVGDRKSRAKIARSPARLTVFVDGNAFGFSLPDALTSADEAGSGGDVVVAPMPGLVKILTAKAGQSVAKGNPLAVLEAMKMEHTLTAPRDGAIAEVLVAEGAQVQDGAVLLTLEAIND